MGRGWLFSPLVSSLGALRLLCSSLWSSRFLVLNSLADLVDNHQDLRPWFLQLVALSAPFVFFTSSLPSPFNFLMSVGGGG